MQYHPYTNSCLGLYFRIRSILVVCIPSYCLQELPESRYRLMMEQLQKVRRSRHQAVWTSIIIISMFKQSLILAWSAWDSRQLYIMKYTLTRLIYFKKLEGRFTFQVKNSLPMKLKQTFLHSVFVYSIHQTELMDCFCLAQHHSKLTLWWCRLHLKVHCPDCMKWSMLATQWCWYCHRHHTPGGIQSV